jgi:1,4-dihydroxy-2-naphthoyl-CoA hydrolase
MSETKQNSLKFLLDQIRDPQLKTMMNALGIEMTYVGLDAVRATMPVDGRTVQYMGILHGGASVALAETVASCAACAHVDLTKQRVVGLEINANHLRSVPGGKGFKVHAEAKPVHIGRKTQVWAINIVNDEGKQVCVSRCTLAVVDA